MYAAAIEPYFLPNVISNDNDELPFAAYGQFD